MENFDTAPNSSNTKGRASYAKRFVLDTQAFVLDTEGRVLDT